MNRKLILAFLVAGAIFIGSYVITDSVPQNILSQAVWVRQIIFKTLLTGFSILIMILAFKGSLSDMGFKKAKAYSKWKVMLPGFLLGGGATLLFLMTNAAGNPVVKQFNLVQMIWVIWIYSSLTEEIFTRGLIQSYLSDLREIKIQGWGIHIFISAVIFGAMHLSLVFAGADILTTFITIIFTFLLGLFAGKFREQYDSLWPAFWTHAAFNIGGMLIGIIYAIIHLAVTGELPIEKV